MSEMSLRERCRRLYHTLDGHLLTTVLASADIDNIEAFARQIRAEAFDECLNSIGQLFHENVNMRSPDWTLLAMVWNDIQSQIRALKSKEPA